MQRGSHTQCGANRGDSSKDPKRVPTAAPIGGHCGCIPADPAPFALGAEQEFMRKVFVTARPRTTRSVVRLHRHGFGADTIDALCRQRRDLEVDRQLSVHVVIKIRAPGPRPRRS